MQTQKTRQARRAMRFIWAALIISVAALAIAASSKPAKPSNAAANQPANNYAGLAQQVVYEYLTGEKSTLPLAQGLQTNFGLQNLSTTSNKNPLGVEQITYLSDQFGNVKIAPAHGGKPAQYQKWVTDAFEAHTTSGNFLVSVDLSLLGQYPVLASDPAVQPLPNPQGTANTSPITVPGTVVSSSDPLYSALSSQAKAWAKAFAANDQPTLYSLSGDTHAQHFAGLGGYNVQSAQLISATRVHGGSEAVALVQVSFQSNSDHSIQFASEYALLFTDLTNAAPPPVAWGPAGSYASLRPYGNALPGLAHQQNS